MADYKTLSEVSELTGLSPREIRYYVEEKMIMPSAMIQKGKRTYAQYSNSDVVKIQQIALYKELGYSNEQIKEILSDPEFDYQSALDKQILELRNKKRHMENQIIAAEMMRTIYLEEKINNLDISDFDNSIDSFSSDLLSPELEEYTEEGLIQFGENLFEQMDKTSISKTLFEFENIYDELLNIVNKDPRSDEVQQKFLEIKDICDPYFNCSKSDSEPLSLNCFILYFRWITALGVDRLFDVFLRKENTAGFIDEMLDEYRLREEAKKHG